MNEFLKILHESGMERHQHQEECVRWCVAIEQEGHVFPCGTDPVRSGIVADEMGLGKTIQMIGLTVARIRRHSLIVLPRALLEQWVRVIGDLLGHSPFVYHGTRARAQTDLLQSAPIVVTTYGTLAAETPKRQEGKLPDPVPATGLLGVYWDRVIFDEAHHMRNRSTRVHRAAVALRAEHRWLLTGTPVQNSLSDIRALCSLLGLPDAYIRDPNNLSEVLRKLMLHRTVEDVGMSLPALVRHTSLVAWESPEEKQVAEDIHAMLRFSGVLARRDPGDAVPPHHFAILQQARQSCIDSSLLETTIASLRKSGVVDARIPDNVHLSGRSKMNAVVSTISSRTRERKKLVFCHYRKEIDVLVSRLSSAGLRVASFDGRITLRERAAALNREDIDVLVLQIKTGCEGLNLQQFTEVYFVTPHWNPAVEDQAVARCYRQGQTERVDVFVFQMAPFDEDRATRTLDLHIRSVQLRKRLLMSSVRITDGDGSELPESCAICLQPQHRNTRIKLPCGHSFHAACVHEWSLRNSTCPTCRQ